MGCLCSRPVEDRSYRQLGAGAKETGNVAPCDGDTAAMASAPRAEVHAHPSGGCAIALRWNDGELGRTAGVPPALFRGFHYRYEPPRRQRSGQDPRTLPYSIALRRKGVFEAVEPLFHSSSNCDSGTWKDFTCYGCRISPPSASTGSSRGRGKTFHSTRSRKAVTARSCQGTSSATSWKPTWPPPDATTMQTWRDASACACS